MKSQAFLDASPVKQQRRTPLQVEEASKALPPNESGTKAILYKPTLKKHALFIPDASIGILL